MRRIVAALLLAALPAAAAALTAREIEAGAKKAPSGLRPVVRKLASTEVAGRDNDTPGSTRAQAFLIRRLRRLGRGLVSGQRGSAAYRQPFEFEQADERGTNLLAVIRGRELPEEYVIVGGHYDHLDSRSRASDGRCSRSFDPGGAICNGATDNAAGTAAVLAIGRAIRKLPTPPRRSVVLALWDAEEDGLLGSLFYVQNPLVPLAQTVAYVNFDIQGAVLLPSLRNASFAVGGETGGSVMRDLVAAVVGAEGLGTRPITFLFGQLRSDYANFVSPGGVPTVFFSDSTGPCYHTAGDDLNVVDWKKLRTQSRIGYRVVANLAEAASVPIFVPPGAPTYEDATVLRDVFHLGIADQALFGAKDQARLQEIVTQLDAVVADGEGAFDINDAPTLINAALDGIDAIGRLPCAPLAPLRNDGPRR